jgi:hypothetical protein
MARSSSFWPKLKQSAVNCAAFAGMTAASGQRVGPGTAMLHALYVVLFATTAGFTASGIVANIYRLAVKKRADTSLGRIAYLSVMIFAGPSVLFENAAKSWRTKDCSAFAFSLAAAIAGYWSFGIGLLVVQVALAL